MTARRVLSWLALLVTVAFIAYFAAGIIDALFIGEGEPEVPPT